MKFQILCCVITASTAKHGDNTTEPEFSINADVMLILNESVGYVVLEEHRFLVKSQQANTQFWLC